MPIPEAIAGGVLIGAGASVLLWADGRTAGVSGMLGGLVRPPGDTHLGERAAFVAGLILVGAVAAVVAPTLIGAGVAGTLPLAALAGLLVGVGTSLGSGCTSGHGVCGLSRGSVRSLVATCTFMATGMITGSLLGWLGSAS